MDPLIGQIQLFAFNFAPQGWMSCNGELLPIAEYQALFSLIGTTFGGNGITDFALPDYLDSAPKGSQYCIAVTGNSPPQ